MTGPVCESWYLAVSRDDYVNGPYPSCRHDSCWNIMCYGDAPVGQWFRTQPEEIT